MYFSIFRNEAIEEFCGEKIDSKIFAKSFFSRLFLFTKMIRESCNVEGSISWK